MNCLILQIRSDACIMLYNNNVCISAYISRYVDLYESNIFSKYFQLAALKAIVNFTLMIFFTNYVIQ